MFQNENNSNKTETRKGRITTSDYLDWNQLLNLMNNLKRDGEYSLLMASALGSYLGLRYSDMIKLKWSDLLNKDQLTIIEQKTQKVKQFPISSDLKSIMYFVYNEDINRSEFPIRNRNGLPMTIQYLNRTLKKLKYKYTLKITNFSVHTFRKSFGRRVYENNFQSEHALVLLSDIFKHSSVVVTRKYLGLRKEEIQNVYLNL
jgi:integrase